jgi:hypothetical protein
LVLLALLVFASLPLGAKSGFSGVYAIKGTNPGVGAYSGTLTISPRGDIYDVHWAIGNLQYAGIGLVTGDTLAVAYSNGTYTGVIAYRSRADGTLDGKWAVYGGKTQLGSETATRK